MHILTPESVLQATDIQGHVEYLELNAMSKRLKTY